MIQERVTALRALMKTRGLSAYIIPGTDAHQSEYVCDRWKTRAWISGFTGSAGTVVVTEKSAGLWTDSRYYLQAERQLQGTGISLFRFGLPGVPDYPGWLAQELPEKSVVGMAADEVTIAQTQSFTEEFSGRQISFAATEDLLDIIWEDRPAVPKGPLRELTVEQTGMSRSDKIDMVLETARRKGADSVLIASLDDIAWLMNLRGSDIAYNPLFLAYVCITEEGTTLFCDQDREHSQEIFSHLEEDLNIAPYMAVRTELPRLLENSRKVFLSPDKVSMGLKNLIPEHVGMIKGMDITTEMKAVKNPAELDGMKRVHRSDGAALVSFFFWLEKRWRTDENPLDECSFAQVLLEYRAANPEFLGESFAPIAGFRDHGAVVHYSATAESAYRITGDGLMILDTGGQYDGGTTDITRTLLFGKPTAEQKRDYTIVLKAHLALARQQFPEGTCGYQLDTVARMELWKEGLTYGHGTGHGVGHMLNVHEGPQNISPKPVMVPLLPGMVVSNEPGLYRTGKYGIRIENLVTVVELGEQDFGMFYGFEDLTLCPYERRLIDVSLLTEQERLQVDAYHERVCRELQELLSEEVLEWLKEKTMPLR